MVPLVTVYDRSDYVRNKQLQILQAQQNIYLYLTHTVTLRMSKTSQGRTSILYKLLPCSRSLYHHGKGTENAKNVEP